MRLLNAKKDPATSVRGEAANKADDNEQRGREGKSKDEENAMTLDECHEFGSFIKLMCELTYIDKILPGIQADILDGERKKSFHTFLAKARNGKSDRHNTAFIRLNRLRLGSHESIKSQKVASSFHNTL